MRYHSFINRCNMVANKGSLLREKMMKKDYGINIKERSGIQKPVVMALSDSEKSRVVLNSAKKVIETHAKVIKALASR